MDSPSPGRPARRPTCPEPRAHVTDILRLSAALFLVQAGFHGFTASLPVALARALVPDATIGLIVGSAALVQIPVAILGGRMVDRFGGLRLFYVGGACYLAGIGILLLPDVSATGSMLPFVLARVFQGAGIGLTGPAALSLVPRILAAHRHGSGLSYVGAAQNLTGVLAPPLSIAILDTSSLRGVALALVVFVVAGLLLAVRLPVAPAVHDPAAGGAAVRFGIRFHRSWAAPLAIIVCYVAHWGAVTAYLPVRAEQAGADVGLYFAADGVGIFLMRLAGARLVDRVSSRLLVVTGGIATACAIGMLLLPLTTPLLIVSGLIGGAAGALVMTPLLLELSRRATDADRGSAFALFSGSIAVAMSLGAFAGAPIVATLGLSAALAAGIVLIGVGMVITISDASLGGTAGTGGGPGGEETDVVGVAG